MDVIGARATESARIGGLRLKCLSHTLVLDRSLVVVVSQGCS
jgi:hypothetical protein